MRTRYVQLDGELVEVGQDYANPRHANVSHNIIPDIQPYKAIAIDQATGECPVITSRSQHRAFLRRNGYEEIGNDKAMAPLSREQIARRQAQYRDTAPMVDVETMRRKGWIEESY